MEDFWVQGMGFEEMNFGEKESVKEKAEGEGVFSRAELVQLNRPVWFRLDRFGFFLDRFSGNLDRFFQFSIFSSPFLAFFSHLLKICKLK